MNQMNSIIQQTFQTNISVSSLRFISSLSLVENPLNFPSSSRNDTVSLDLFHLFNAQIRTRKPTIKETKTIHAHIIKSALFQSDLFVANSLADWYCNSAAMTDALRLFEEIPYPNLISWNLIISGYNQNSRFLESWRIFCRMHSSGFNPNQFTYGSVLFACAASEGPLSGKQVYSLVIKNGLFSDGYVRTGMIDLFAKHCNFQDALRVFQDVSCENVVCWNAIIAGAIRNKENQVALDLFHQMLVRCLMPNTYTLSSILTACGQLGELEMGRRVHGKVIKCGAGEDVFLGTAIVDLYAKCGGIDEAVKEFLQMPIRNVVSWTVIISGFVQMEDSVTALQFFKEMRAIGEEINNYTVTSVLAACAKPPMMREAIQIHSWIFKTGFYLDSTVIDSLINMYSKIGAMDLSVMVFNEIGSTKDIGTWAVMISAFAQSQSPERTIELFQRMCLEGLRPNKFCASSVLSIIDCFSFGRQIHCYLFKAGLALDVSVASALFTMYSKCGSLEEAYEVFEQIHDKDKVSWTSMIAGFAEHGCEDRAFQLFREMACQEITPDQITLVAILTACSSIQSLKHGKEVHGYALRVGVGSGMIVVGGALVNMYSKCRDLVSSRRVFEAMPVKDQVSWSSLVSGYTQNGYTKEAMLLFHDMLTAGLEIDCFTISSVLAVAPTLTRSGLGDQLHGHIVRTGLDLDLSVGSSLVTLYSKCGRIDDAHKVFDQIEKPDLVTWTAMIVGYAQHGKGLEALGVYKLMIQEGMKPDSVTFVGVLSACSHNGLVEEGHFHLNSMTKDYGIEPGSHHYACMVDLLARSGRLKEAERFIHNMPINPDALVWGTLLGSCRVHGDSELGKLAAKKILELEPHDAGAYVSLSNICADGGHWEEVLKIRSMMTGAGMKKEPGWSSV